MIVSKAFKIFYHRGIITYHPDHVILSYTYYYMWCFLLYAVSNSNIIFLSFKFKFFSTVWRHCCHQSYDIKAGTTLGKYMKLGRPEPARLGQAWSATDRGLRPARPIRVTLIGLAGAPSLGASLIRRSAQADSSQRLTGAPGRRGIRPDRGLQSAPDQADPRSGWLKSKINSFCHNLHF